MLDAVLTINAGSSSIKFALFEIEPKAGPCLLNHGEIEGIGTAPHFLARDQGGTVLAERRWTDAAITHETVFAELLRWIDGHLGEARLVAAGHRVVHGGRRLVAPAQVTAAVLAELDSLVPLAPLHQPHSLSAIRAVATLRPELVQVACFDTAFHRTNAAVVRRIALPRELTDQGIERYGFHGLSYEYIASRLPETAPGLAGGKVVVAHLGNGASLCALRAGRSIDTTMGFSTLDGLMMGTRCGALDPGAMLFMQQALHMDAAAIEQALYHRSGLLGVSGISGDMRALRADDSGPAKAAIELFVHRLLREVAAMAASLRGIDGLVFTAGIGEHDTALRAAACDGLQWLGVSLDRDANQAAPGRISASASGVEVWVIATDEEAIIARHTIATVAT